MIGATNRPFDLDEAALRRLTKRIYIGLPDGEARIGQIRTMLKGAKNKISVADFWTIKRLTEGYSSADIASLVKEAAYVPLREYPPSQIVNLSPDQIRPINLDDFKKAARACPPSVSPSTIK